MTIQIVYGFDAEGTVGHVHGLIEVAIIEAVELTVTLALAANAPAVSRSVAKRLTTLRTVVMGRHGYLGIYVS